jgi:hypothetical protein
VRISHARALLAFLGWQCMLRHGSLTLVQTACWPLQAPKRKPVPVKKLVKIIKKIIKVCVNAFVGSCLQSDAPHQCK